MTVIVCTEDRGGTLFLGRRLSRDRLLIADLTGTVGDGVIYISNFSEDLFSESDASVMCVSDPLSIAGEDDFVFIENLSLAEHIKDITRLIIYRWNRKYPFDTRLDVDPAEHGFSLISSTDFKGKSHEKITKEVYER